jgi:REP element-mobilizing transposase RayT
LARQLRIEYAGAIYHVMSRGDRKEAIFLDDENRRGFLRTLGEACERAGWEVHAYCLMGNLFIS